MKIEDIYKAFVNSNYNLTTDSRKITEGCIFLALKGDNFDGNKFAKEALVKGASKVIIDDPDYALRADTILVDDGLKTLQDLANYHRHQIDAIILGITGSNGKTTTKELLHKVIAKKYKTFATQGNLNNHIGVPLSLLSIRPEIEFAIIEMGANAQGEIHDLSNIASPSFGIITNIGNAHLEGFGGIEGVKKAKSELYRHLSANNGMAFLNREMEFLEDLIGDCKVSFYSQQAEDHWSSQLIKSEPQIEIQLNRAPEKMIIKSALFGEYNFHNMNTALAVGHHFGVSFEDMKEAIESFIPAQNRSEIIHKDSNTFFMDAYNANPSSMRKAIISFAAFPNDNKSLILGDMFELGVYSDQEHLAMIELAKKYEWKVMITVGNEFAKIEHQGLHFSNVVDLKTWFWQRKFKGYTFLLKGSRGVQLEKLLN